MKCLKFKPALHKTAPNYKQYVKYARVDDETARRLTNKLGMHTGTLGNWVYISKSEYKKTTKT